MDMYVRLSEDDDGPVVVKAASPAAEQRLRLEADRLARAVHPGVVTVVPGLGDDGDPPRAELRTRYVGEPVSSWAGTVASIAGLGAAVATTLADLHGVGIVHGRIDASHVLVGDDGRPRLCGFSHPGGAEPADDIAGLALVLSQLLDRARPASGGSLWRRSRGRSGERALRQALDRAADPVPGRRPTARALADAILLAVPSADLPAPPDAQRPTRQPDTLDRIWSAAEQGTEEERWAKALGDGPPDLQRRPESPTLPLADVNTPTWPTNAPDDEPQSRPATPAHPNHNAVPHDTDDTPSWAPLDPDDEPPTRPARRNRPGQHDPGDNHTSPVPGRGESRPSRHRPDDRRSGMADEAHPARPNHTTQQPGDAGEPEPVRLSPRTAAEARRRLDRTATFGSPGDDATAPPPAASDHDGGLTVERPQLTGRGGLGSRSRPPESPTDAEPGRGRARLLLLAGAVVVTAGGAAGLTMLALASSDQPPPGEPIPRSGCPAVASPAADVNGDGCPESLIVDGATITAGQAQWTLGEPGDVAAVGDWDCDGAASAALLRPSTGDVFVFPAWAEAGDPVSVRPITRIAGATGIRATPARDGCDGLVVDLQAGGSRTVEVEA